MTVPLTTWNECIRQRFGWTLIDHPARLRDGLTAASKALGLSDEELLAATSRGDTRALDQLARSLTIGETYFFREPAHFELLRTLLPKLASAGVVHIASAACATGEEAYTLAIVARQVLGDAADTLVRIVGYDVNDASLERANAAVYRPWALRGLSVELRRAWFEEVGGSLRVVQKARSLVRFERRNLSSGEGAIPADSVDILLCRNALIYFDRDAATATLRMLARAVTARGLLLLGTAESGFFSVAGLPTATVDGVTVYAPGLAAVRADASATSPTGVASSIPSSRGRRPGVRRRTARPPPVARSPVPPAPVAPPASPSNLSPEDYVERGFRVLDADPAAAGADARRALLLDRKLVAAHILGASAALAGSDVEAARKALSRARRLLTSEADCTIVPGTGANKSEMMAYCQRLERALSIRKR